MTLLHTQQFWKCIWILPFREIHVLVHWLFRTSGVNSILYILIFSYLAISMLFHMVPKQSILTAEMLIFVMEKFLKISLDCWNAVLYLKKCLEYSAMVQSEKYLITYWEYGCLIQKGEKKRQKRQPHSKCLIHTAVSNTTILPSIW